MRERQSQLGGSSRFAWNSVRVLVILLVLLHLWLIWVAWTGGGMGGEVVLIASGLALLCGLPMLPGALLRGQWRITDNTAALACFFFGISACMVVLLVILLLG